MTPRSTRALLLLATHGCWAPTSTGATSMTGFVRSAEGTPIAGLSVQSPEARAVTGDDGRFAVSYKEPTQFVFFDRDGLRWRRTWQPADRGDIAIQLPEQSARILHCSMPLPCEATLTWTWPDGLAASATVPCEPGDRLVRDLPSGVPAAATCRDDAASPDRPVAVRPWVGPHIAGGFVEGLQVYPGTVALQVQIEPSGRGPTGPCAIVVNGTSHDVTGLGPIEVPVWGWVETWAVCDGRPGPVRRARVQSDAALTVDWRPDGPILDLRPLGVDAERVTLGRPATPEGGPGNGWLMTLPKLEPGRWALPPLSTGRHHLGFDAPDEEVVFRSYRPEVPSDVVWIEDDATVARRPDGDRYGLVEPTAPLLTGSPRVAWSTDAHTSAESTSSTP